MTTYMVDLMQCPNCACRFTSWSVASCNTFGAKFYTDGYVDGPMYDDGSQLLECPRCSEFLWREDIPIVESVRDNKYFESEELKKLPSAAPIHGRQYEEALHMALWHNETQEKYIRIRAWWSFNRGYRGEIDGYVGPEEARQMLYALYEEVDPDHNDTSMVEDMLHEQQERNEAARRKFAETYMTLDMTPPRGLPPDQAANLERLAGLLDPGNAHESVLRAEALRELGHFDECLRVLDRTFDESLERATTQIRQLAMQGKKRVELLA